MDDLKQNLVQVLNQARNLEKRTVGNAELTERILAIPAIATLIERDKPKRPTHVYDGEEVCDCGLSCEYDWHFCARCGQRLNWK